MSSDLNRVPIIKIWDILLVPLQGEITDDLAARLKADVLERIHTEGATGLVIDVTALWMMDSHLCHVISRLATAASLMGARTFLCGMNPDIALRSHTMDLDLESVQATLTLEEALELLGLQRPPRLLWDEEPMDLEGR